MIYIMLYFSNDHKFSTCTIIDKLNLLLAKDFILTFTNINHVTWSGCFYGLILTVAPANDWRQELSSSVHSIFTPWMKWSTTCFSWLVLLWYSRFVNEFFQWGRTTEECNMSNNLLSYPKDDELKTRGGSILNNVAIINWLHHGKRCEFENL